MELTSNGIELVIDHPKWLKLMHDGIINVREALQLLYGVGFATIAYDPERRIELNAIVYNGKEIGRAFVTGEDNDALKRGETVKLTFTVL